jgi:beta-lactamase class A
MSSVKWIALMLLAVVASASATWLVLKPATKRNSNNSTVNTGSEIAANHTGLPCDNVSIVRDNDPSLTKPFLYADVSCESDDLQPLKTRLTAYIEEQKASGVIKRASVYYKELNSLHWTSAFNGELYYPGSTMKVPLLLTILKQAQRDKTLLERKIQFQTPTKIEVLYPAQNPMVVGNFYTVQELLERMILKSDNDATSLLFSIYNKDLYDDLFIKLSIPVQGAEDVFYQIAPSDISKFMRVLYNASYLSSLYSEYALDLLTKAEFKNGILAGVPPSVKVAHKFGERFTTGDLMQLHETAIVYRGGTAYAVTIMTEGKDTNQLAVVVGQLSKICYEQKKPSAQDPMKVTSHQT